MAEFGPLTPGEHSIVAVKPEGRKYLVPTSPAEAAHDAIDDVRPKVKVGHFNDQGAHGFQRNFSKFRLSCRINQGPFGVIRRQELPLISDSRSCKNL